MAFKMKSPFENDKRKNSRVRSNRIHINQDPNEEVRKALEANKKAEEERKNFNYTP